MIIVIPSDLHMCDGSGADEFLGCDYYFVRTFKALDFPFKMVVNGDRLELQQGSEKEANEAHAETIEYFEEIGAVYVRGNHDRKAKGNIKFYEFTMADGRKGIIIHGDKSDWRMLFTGRIVGFLGLLERIDPALQNIDNPELWSKKAVAKAKKKLDKYVMKLLKKGYDIVVTAHTHTQGIEIIMVDGVEKTHINCGHCMHGAVQYTKIDTNACTVQMV